MNVELCARASDLYVGIHSQCFWLKPTECAGIVLSVVLSLSTKSNIQYLNLQHFRYSYIQFVCLHLETPMYVLVGWLTDWLTDCFVCFFAGTLHNWQFDSVADIAIVVRWVKVFERHLIFLPVLTLLMFIYYYCCHDLNIRSLNCTIVALKVVPLSLIRILSLTLFHSVSLHCYF